MLYLALMSGPILEYLARQLALNHYSISVAEGNPDLKNSNFEKDAPGLDKIFIKPPTKSSDEYGYSRNILIVGAGASKNTYDFFATSTTATEILNTKIGLKDLLNNDNFKNKYLEEASKISGHLYSAVEQLKLGFEDNLQLLSIFFSHEDIVKTLKEAIGNQVFKDDPNNYLSSLPYEIIAHLFKHRYIDVIINLNFDEMLDNAIEDEMGNSTYHRIIDDTDCWPLDDILDEKRLRIPIYVKPHGSFRSLSSMKFMKQHYIVLPTDIRDLLKNIFSGKIDNQTNNNIRRFNIIMLGYGLNDLDVQNIIFNQLCVFSNEGEAIKELNYFVFDSNPNFQEEFIAKFEKWIEIIEPNEEFRKKTTENVKSRVDQNFKIVVCGSDKNAYNQNELNVVNGLGYNFKELYENIRGQFNNEFYAPQPLVRHELLALFFPRNKFKEGFNHSKSSITPKEYFKKRAFNAGLFAFIKHRGKVPINTLFSDRTGKYQIKYKKECIESEYLGITEYLQEKMKKIFGENSVKIKESYLVCEAFIKLNVWKNSEKLKRIIDCFFENSYADASDLIIKNGKLVNSFDYATELLLNYVYDTRVNEINAIYNDPKHGRFFPFRKESIIVTNLELTWIINKFTFYYDWDKLLIISERGNVLHNLMKKNSSNSEISNKEIQLLVCSKIDDIYMRDSKTTIKGSFENYNFPNMAPIKRIDDEMHWHRMAVFLYNGQPRYGIYYFKPSTKIRINPVCFDYKKDKNDNENLDILMKFFYDAEALAVEI
jgi:hypothetical protein